MTGQCSVCGGVPVTHVQCTTKYGTRLYCTPCAEARVALYALAR